MSKIFVLNLVLVLVMLTAAFGLWRARTPGRPTGNVVGTRFEHSEALRKVQWYLLLLLLATCAAALLLLNASFVQL